MKTLTQIIEATAPKVHPNALHVSSVKVDGKTKYHVKAVGKNFAHGIKPGEVLDDTHLDDFTEMGGDVKHVKEDVEQIEEAKATYCGRCGTTHVPPKFGGKCPAVKEEVEPEADQHIIVQLKKAGDILEHGTQGGCDVKFGDGQSAFVEGAAAVKILESMERLKPEDRARVSEFLYQSHDNLMAVFARLK